MQKVDSNISIQQLGVLGLILFLLTNWSPLLFFVLVLLLGSLAELGIVRRIAGLWQRGLTAIGNVNSKILLTALFYIFITPYAYLFRVFHRASTRTFMGKDADVRTSWGDPDGGIVSRESFERLW